MLCIFKQTAECQAKKACVATTAKGPIIASPTFPALSRNTSVDKSQHADRREFRVKKIATGNIMKTIQTGSKWNKMNNNRIWVIQTAGERLRDNPLGTPKRKSLVCLKSPKKRWEILVFPCDLLDIDPIPRKRISTEGR